MEMQNTVSSPLPWEYDGAMCVTVFRDYSSINSKGSRWDLHSQHINPPPGPSNPHGQQLPCQASWSLGQCWAKGVPVACHEAAAWRHWAGS